MQRKSGLQTEVALGPVVSKGRHLANPAPQGKTAEITRFRTGFCRFPRAFNSNLLEPCRLARVTLANGARATATRPGSSEQHPAATAHPARPWQGQSPITACSLAPTPCRAGREVRSVPAQLVDDGLCCGVAAGKPGWLPSPQPAADHDVLHCVIGRLVAVHRQAVPRPHLLMHRLSSLTCILIRINLVCRQSFKQPRHPGNEDAGG